MPFAAVALAAALAASPGPPPRLRPDPAIGALVQQAADRSPSVRALIDRLEASDVVVYVRLRAFVAAGLDGRVGLLAATASGERYLLIELACGRSEVTTMATLGHELFHALEIARAPEVVDTASLAVFYARVGMRSSDRVGRVTFETIGAQQAGAQARRELLTTTARHTWTLK